MRVPQEHWMPEGVDSETRCELPPDRNSPRSDPDSKDRQKKDATHPTAGGEW
jgi:hypothetical protein